MQIKFYLQGMYTLRHYFLFSHSLTRFLRPFSSWKIANRFPHIGLCTCYILYLETLTSIISYSNTCLNTTYTKICFLPYKQKSCPFSLRKGVLKPLYKTQTTSKLHHSLGLCCIGECCQDQQELNPGICSPLPLTLHSVFFPQVITNPAPLFQSEF